jgi:hypothetical protein
VNVPEEREMVWTVAVALLSLAWISLAVAQGTYPT